MNIHRTIMCCSHKQNILLFISISVIATHRLKCRSLDESQARRRTGRMSTDARTPVVPVFVLHMPSRTHSTCTRLTVNLVLRRKACGRGNARISVSPRARHDDGDPARFRGHFFSSKIKAETPSCDALIVFRV